MPRPDTMRAMILPEFGAPLRPATVPVPKIGPNDVLLRVRDSLRSIRFGTVLIVVQDGTVVQIETAEKIRLR